MIRVGTCGWSYFSPSNFIKEWKEKYASRLQAYASIFDTLEVDSTFYKLPKVETAIKWHEEAKAVSKNFEFIPKAPKSITHNNFDMTDLEKFIQVAKAMKASKLLFQTPPSFGYSQANYKLVKNFFAKIKGFAIFWEPRGTWLEEANVQKLKGIGASIVTDPLRQVVPFQQETYYFRLHGFGKGMMYSYRFSDEELKKVKQTAIDISKKGEVYVMFNNTYMFEDSLRFKKMLGI